MAIRAYREQAGLLQVDLAKKLDVDQAAVSNWERGVKKRQSKYTRKMCRMCKGTEAELMQNN